MFECVLARDTTQRAGSVFDLLLFLHAATPRHCMRLFALTQCLMIIFTALTSCHGSRALGSVGVCTLYSLHLSLSACMVLLMGLRAACLDDGMSVLCRLLVLFLPDRK